MLRRSSFTSRLCLAFLATLLLAAGPAAAEWVDLGGDEPVTVRLLEDDGSRSVVEIIVGGFDAEIVDIGGQEYTLVNLMREGLEMEVGLPQLPNVRRSLIIPDDREMGVRVLSSDHVDLADIRVAPSKGHLSREVDPARVPYTFDAYYQTGGLYPAAVAELDEPYILRDHRGVVVDANVMQYDANAQTLRVFTRLVLEIAPVGPGQVNVLERDGLPDRVDTQFANLYENHFLNYGQASRYAPLQEDGSLLIIAYDAYASYMAPLVEWKNQKGLQTRLVTLADTGPTYASIYNYILNEYQTTDLAYVLLVGDGQHVPKYGSNSDPEYSLLAGGDSYPEIFVGRFSAESPAHVQTQVARTIAYERDTAAGAGSQWLQSGTGIASNQGPGHFGEYDNQHMDLIRGDLLGYGYSVVDQFYDPSATVSMVANAVNAGRGIMNYCGHGSTNAWSTTGFSSSNVNALVNDGMLPFIVSVACNNGTFTGGTCFGEAWLRATHNGAPTGAIACYMSYISQSWNPPMYAQDEAVDLLIAEQMRTVGGLWFNGSCEMMDATGSSGANEFLNWMIFGDPSVCIRTESPETMAVSHAGVVFLGLGEFAVEVPGVEGALCALYADGVLYGTGVTDAAGQATVTMASPPAGPMDITLTVTAYNRVTVVETLPVVSPSIVVIEPQIVPAGVPTDVTVTVLQNDGITPIPNVQLQLTDPMTYGLVATTGPDGVAVMTVDYPFGTPLILVGTDPSAGFLFNDQVVVTAAPLVDPDLTVMTDPGIEGVFVMNLPGTLTAVTGTPDVAVRAYVPGIGFFESVSGVLEITPPNPGEVVTWIVKEGHDLYSEVFPIVTTPSAHGSVVLSGEVDHSGVMVTAEPGGYVATSAADGSWHLLDLEAGTYQLTASKEGWTSDYAEITLADGQHVTGIAFSLSVVYTANECVQTEIPIPDPDGVPVDSPQMVAESGAIDWVRVYVDITHPWIGNLQVTLTSPEGTPVLLHNRSGGFAADIVGWYPDDFEPAGNLANFIGEDVHGEWTLTVADQVWGMTGVLNGWCLDIGYAGGTVAVGDSQLPAKLDLAANYPNPFNPMTTIAFSLPKDSHVALEVFDLRGRQIATLVDGSLPAGHHQAVWTGRDGAGRQAASGLYVYRLTADGQALTRKMLLLK